MKVSDYIARFIAARGVAQVYEMSGGMITHLLDSIYLQGRPKIVSMHHEQAAAFAADATARLTGVPGVAMATSGPGATNLLTGVASCYFDSSPAVFITGQVHRLERRGDRPIRQLGFQETDIVAIAAPITKGAWQVETAGELPLVLERAFRTALEGRPGPVIVDIPMDIQYEEMPADVPSPQRVTAGVPVVPASVEEALELLGAAERPLILAGGGIRAARAREARSGTAPAPGRAAGTSASAARRASHRC